jgi:hypothetical protein
LILHISLREVNALIEELSRIGLVDITTDCVRPHNWEKWQPASDNAAERMNKRRTNSEHVRPVVEHVRPRREEIRSEEEKIRQEEEEEEERAPAHPFALTYVKRYQERHAGQRPPQTEHAAALSLEREYGASPCIQLGNDLDWSKHPNYMRPILEERRNGKSDGADRRFQAAGVGAGGVADGVSNLERLRLAVAARERGS